ncbi:MAG: CheR family methyltransferase [Thermodesulfobacteriota bacterium]
MTTIPEELKTKFKGLVTSRSGLYFKDHELKDLEKAILNRMKEQKVDSSLAYYDFLTVSEERENEFRELLNCLTVNHTYFFRNEPQFKVLKEKVLPWLIAEKKKHRMTNDGTMDGKPSLRIWSAGCSTGEEPYSVAIVVNETIPELENWDIQILATDASNSALEVARKGTYGQNSMRFVSQERKDLYFVERKSVERIVEYEIRDSIRNIVQFSYLNLMEECYPTTFDIIFCCNVTIYFENRTTMEVMDKIHRSLNGDGYLFVGPSESLHYISDRFKMFDWEDAIYYRKRRPKEVYSEAILTGMDKAGVDGTSEKISQGKAGAGLGEIPSREIDPEKRASDFLAEASRQLHAKKYATALTLIEQAHKIGKDSEEIYYLEAEALSRLKRFEEAKDRLKTAFKLNPLFAPAHYLLGFLFIEEGLMEDAKRSFKKAIYLNKDFTLAHLGLATIYITEGKSHEAIREYRNTLNILAKHAPEDIVAFSGGFSAVAVADTCKINIERLKKESQR